MMPPQMRGGGPPVLVLNTNSERDIGHKAQLGNITAAKAVANIIRTTLGPRSMLKMVLDPMGGIVITNDGNSILREIDVNHPAAKSMIELSRTVDEEVGDGTTTVIILAGEMLQVAEPFLERRMHPRTIVAAYTRAMVDAEEVCKSIARDLDLSDERNIVSIIRSTIGTKFVSRYGNLVCELALRAVMTIREEAEDGSYIMDIKRFARVEKVPGGEVAESRVLDGVMVNKDVLHPKMRRRIENPRILCLDCPMEYNKGESQTNIEIAQRGDFEAYMAIEEESIKKMCDKIIALKPDVVVTEKGCAELAQHFLVRHNITVLRRMRKTDNVRLARASGATIGYNIDIMSEKDIGTKCGLYHVEQVAGETFSFFTQCRDPLACTILLRGGSKDVLQEMDRNLQDAMAVTRNIIKQPRVLPGGGATEMAISVALFEKAKSIDSVEQWPYRAVAEAMDVVPRTLIQNCGQQPIKVLTELRAKQSDATVEHRHRYGVDGHKGTIVDMDTLGIWEPFAVKVQTIKTAIESAAMLLRIDDVVSGLRNKEE